jgi:hypothetical protein
MILICISVMISDIENFFHVTSSHLNIFENVCLSPLPICYLVVFNFPI